MENKIIKIFLSLVAFIVTWVYVEYGFYTCLGITFFVFFAVEFFLTLGVKIDIRSVIILLGALQWVVGPTMAYHYKVQDPIFYMAVEEEEYMSFIVPALIMLSIGLYLPIFKKVDQRRVIVSQIKVIMEKYPWLDIALIISGMMASYFTYSVAFSLTFVMFLLGFMRFIGAFFILLSNRPGKWVWTGVILLNELSVSVGVGMFHDLLLWLSFFLLVVAFIYKFNVITKLITLSAGVGFIFIIQAVKHEVRAMGLDVRSISVFSDIVVDKAQDTEFLTSDVFLDTWINRLNQGWIIARIMNYVPTQEPFAEGETVMTAIKESVLIGFVSEKKTFAGYSTYFQRFTGSKLATGTSMDISIVGEAYANYGRSGGVVFMFFLGLFYNFIYHSILKISLKYPLLLFFMPLIFLHMVKAETDLASTLNYFTKSSLLIFFMFWATNFVLDLKVKNAEEIDNSQNE